MQENDTIISSPTYGDIIITIQITPGSKKKKLSKRKKKFILLKKRRRKLKKMSNSSAATEAPYYLSSPIHDDVSAEIKEHTAHHTTIPTMATEMVCKKEWQGMCNCKWFLSIINLFSSYPFFVAMPKISIFILFATFVTLHTVWCIKNITLLESDRLHTFLWLITDI